MINEKAGAGCVRCGKTYLTYLTSGSSFLNVLERITFRVDRPKGLFGGFIIWRRAILSLAISHIICRIYAFLAQTNKYNSTHQYKRRSKTGQGRLAFRLTEGDSPNPLWLVTFDRASVKDEEIYEKHFTRLIEKSKGPKPDGRKTKGKRGGARRRSSGSDEEAGNDGEDAAPPQDAAEGKSGSNSSSDDKSSSGGGRRSKKDKKSRRAEDAASAESKDDDEEDDGAASDSSAPSTKKGKGGVDRADRAASRAARSQRRQAMIEVTVTEEVSKKTSGAKRAADAAAADDENGKKAKPADDEVVKVKMNTGTLYLYKGLHRRVVFVRKF